MLHDGVVAVSIDADIAVVGKAEVHDAFEDTMSIGLTGYAVDHVIGQLVINPTTIVNLGIRRFG